jgi:hypothetical protein
MAKCSNCERRRKLDQDGLCKECRAEITAQFEGAMCSRCDINLTFDGYCPNDRCPFSNTYQDESDGDWELPDKKERHYIETVVKKRPSDR